MEVLTIWIITVLLLLCIATICLLSLKKKSLRVLLKANFLNLVLKQRTKNDEIISGLQDLRIKKTTI